MYLVEFHHRLWNTYSFACIFIKISWISVTEKQNWVLKHRLSWKPCLPADLIKWGKPHKIMLDVFFWAVEPKAKKPKHNTPSNSLLPVFHCIALYVRKQAEESPHWFHSVIKPLDAESFEWSIMVNMWHLAGWLLWLQVHSFKGAPASDWSEWVRQFHHQLTFFIVTDHP